MNFTFLVILSLIILSFTYRTLKISDQALCVTILVLLILLVSYNIKEKFQDSEEEPKKFFLFSGSPIQRIRNFFNMDDTQYRIKNRNIRAKALEISNNIE